MSNISHEIIEEINNKTDIVSLINEYIPLNKQGRNFFGVCPFHNDTNPSMSVSKEKSIYKCFVCGATGNSIKFLTEYKKISFMEAIKILSDKLGMNLNITNYNHTVDKLSIDSYKIYELITKYYEHNLYTKNGVSAREYLNKRSISDEIIKKFRIGLSSIDYDSATKLLVNKDFSKEKLVSLGISNRNDYGYNDLFIKRIMFPLFDNDGYVVGFSGRIYNNENTSKYINTKETDIFVKGKILYNYKNAKESCLKEKKLIIVEGFMDVIRLYSVGIYNVVATMGTALTKEQALLISKLSTNVILCFDGDKAGASATYSCGNELLKIDISPKVIRLEQNLDPDEYIIKHGRVVFDTKLEGAMSYTDFKIEYFKVGKNMNDAEDIAKYINEIVKEVNIIEDDTLKLLTINKISKDIGVDEEIIKAKINNLEVPITEIKVTKNTIKQEKKEELKLNYYRKYEIASKSLLFYMLKDVNVIKIYQNKMPYLPSEKYRILASEIVYFYKKYGRINEVMFIETFKEDEIIKIINEIISMNLSLDYELSLIDNFIENIKEYNKNLQVKHLNESIKNEMDVFEQAEYLKQIIEIKGS